jgi:hypothetical protein
VDRHLSPALIVQHDELWRAIFGHRELGSHLTRTITQNDLLRLELSAIAHEARSREEGHDHHTDDSE